MNIMDMLRRAKEMSQRVQEMQEQARKITVEGSAGGGMVVARMNGAGELLKLDIDRSAVDPDDLEMLGDLVVSAVNAARKKVDDQRLEQVKEMTGGIDLSALGIDPSKFMG